MYNQYTGYQKVSRENLSLPPKKQNGFKAIVYNPLDFCAGKMGALPIKKNDQSKIGNPQPVEFQFPCPEGRDRAPSLRRSAPIPLGCMAVTVGRLWL